MLYCNFSFITATTLTKYFRIFRLSVPSALKSEWPKIALGCKNSSNRLWHIQVNASEMRTIPRRLLTACFLS